MKETLIALQSISLNEFPVSDKVHESWGFSRRGQSHSKMCPPNTATPCVVVFFFVFFFFGVTVVQNQADFQIDGLVAECFPLFDFHFHPQHFQSTLICQ